MKKILSLLLCCALLSGFACALAQKAELSYEAETFLMPALYMQLSLPAGMETEYMKNRDTLSWKAQYDSGMRYEGENDDLRISIWMNQLLWDVGEEEFVQHYRDPMLGYHVESVKINGFGAYHIWRDAEPDSNGYLLFNGTELVDADAAYVLFFNTPTARGVALRDEILSTLDVVASDVGAQ